MKSYSVTDVGQARRDNQDYVFASLQPIGNLPNLFVVADGMGGHNAGDYASRCAVQTIVEDAEKNMSFNPIKIVRHAIEKANEQIVKDSHENPDLYGMGTTVVAVTIVGNYAYVANVGDSRLYLADKEELQQITRDHSWVAEMVRRGEITKEEAQTHPEKNIITRAVGTSEEIIIDFFDVELEEENKILMCTDGLSNMVEDAEIHNILVSANDIKESAMELVNRANENGGTDNISVIIIEPFTDEVKEC